jgi:hypothetical protein
MKQMPLLKFIEDLKLFIKFKKTVRGKQSKRPVEEFHRSLEVVDLVLKDAIDFGMETKVVTWALKLMKNNPDLDISDAIIQSYDTYIFNKHVK